MTGPTLLAFLGNLGARTQGWVLEIAFEWLEQLVGTRHRAVAAVIEHAPRAQDDEFAGAWTHENKTVLVEEVKYML